MRMAAHTGFITIHNGTIGDTVAYPIYNMSMPALGLLDYMYDHPLPPPKNWRVDKTHALLQPLLDGKECGELNAALSLKEFPSLLLKDNRTVACGKAAPLWLVSHRITHHETEEPFFVQLPIQRELSSTTSGSSGIW
jgi:hypothetical protein